MKKDWMKTEQKKEIQTNKMEKIIGTIENFQKTDT
jgi:hypothetical protein